MTHPIVSAHGSSLASLAALPRVPLLYGPTPLEAWARMGERLGIALYAKRDDLTGIGGGGNKLRKLELILGEAVEQGVDWLLTTGGVQSNHARLTAASAAKLGLGCSLHLRGDVRSENGNLLLDRLFGAEIRQHGPVEYPQVYRLMAEHAAELQAKGHRPLAIPLGGATARGTAAYVQAFAEILQDCNRQGFRPDVLLVAAGTASTYAGLELGARLLAPDVAVLGVSVSWTPERLADETNVLIRDTCALLGVKASARELWFTADYIGPGYAQISEAGLREVLAAARTQGVLCDTTYTGKALAGLAGLCGSGVIPKDSKVVFVHTGGAPELYTHSAADLELG
jgi:D-cysteine desulfhydrase family pyridoxal phosphate-dependent enzyme